MMSTDNDHHFMEKEKQLKKSLKYHKVFLSPDRSPSEPEAHKILVMKLKKRIADDPHRHISFATQLCAVLAKYTEISLCYCCI